jgi:hypothetical protein
VIGGVKVSCGDLISAANRESNPMPESKPSDDKTWRYEVLFFSIIFAGLKEGRIEFDLRPKLAKYPVPTTRATHTKGGICRNGAMS